VPAKQVVDSDPLDRLDRLLRGAQELSDPVAAQAWAGMEDASKATSARVSYLAVTGSATEVAAVPFVGSLLVRGCKAACLGRIPGRGGGPLGRRLTSHALKHVGGFRAIACLPSLYMCGHMVICLS
jgi:hypothetical protein